ncbi:hypothetical protein CXX93_08130 [Gordonia sp. YC-JH1]|nr:hypothetical protein CXX93_08130 [Gordonia sp. YC-JH1]
MPEDPERGAVFFAGAARRPDSAVVGRDFPVNLPNTARPWGRARSNRATTTARVRTKASRIHGKLVAIGRITFRTMSRMPCALSELRV